MIGAAATGLVILIALGGTRFVTPGISPWPRFWGIVFFAVVLWPIGLTLVRRIAGVQAQFVTAVGVVALSAAQQFGAGTLPLPLVVRWSVTLAAPGDAIRRELTLPPSGDPTWERAWTRATAVAVALCTEEQVASSSDLTIALNDQPGVPIASLARSGKSDAMGWYKLPVTRAEIDPRRPLTVVVRSEGVAYPPPRICGGQDDPTRPGSSGSARLRADQWLTDQLADVPIPAIGGLPATSRYYVELRFYDASGRPSVGIWY